MYDPDFKIFCDIIHHFYLYSIILTIIISGYLIILAMQYCHTPIVQYAAVNTWNEKRKDGESVGFIDYWIIYNPKSGNSWDGMENTTIKESSGF